MKLSCLELAGGLLKELMHQLMHQLHHHLLLLAEMVSAVTEYSDRSGGGNPVQYGFAFLWCLVPFPVSASVFERSKGEKINPMKALKVFMASDLCLICLETVSDSHLQSKRKHHSV